MRAPTRDFLPLLTSLMILAMIVVGCSDEQNPVGPAPSQDATSLEDGLLPSADALAAAEARGGRKATLRNIWPNDDGRSWTYRIDQRSWSDLLLDIHTYPTSEEVPPAPRLSRVAALLHHHPIGDSPVHESAGYRMQFNGLKTTLSGAVGQNLETTVFDLDAAAASNRGAAADVSPNRVAAAANSGGFLQALSRARPDLVDKIAARAPGAMRAVGSLSAASVNEPLFLFGYAWVKTPEYIGSYGDLNTDLAYKYLDADLRPGSTFSMQLVPDLADDVLLHARVLRERAVRTPAGYFRNALEVLYLVDFGVSFVTDTNGNVLGYWRAYSYGTITYVPHVGPVASYERGLVQPGRPLDPGLFDLSIRLTGTAPGPAAN